MEKELKQIKKLFDEAEQIYDKFTPQQQKAIIDFHNVNFNLTHCVRWGLQASDELIRNFQEFNKQIQR